MWLALNASILSIMHKFKDIVNFGIFLLNIFFEIFEILNTQCVLHTINT